VSLEPLDLQDFKDLQDNPVLVDPVWTELPDLLASPALLVFLLAVLLAYLLHRGLAQSPL